MHLFSLLPYLICMDLTCESEDFNNALFLTCHSPLLITRDLDQLFVKLDASVESKEWSFEFVLMAHFHDVLFYTSWL
jgi:hypothetical protein